MDREKLVELALHARRNSYAPYSNFCVGAAILCDSGQVYTGCNVENASYSGGICAERSAAVQAVSAGERVFTGVAIAGASRDASPQEAGYAYPCGICRQFLYEFAAPGMKVYVAKNQEEIQEFTLDELLPHGFGPESL